MYWEAFNALVGQRVYNNGAPNPLSVSDIKAYGEAQLVERDELGFFVDVLLELDSEFLTFSYERIEQARKEEERKRKIAAARRR